MGIEIAIDDFGTGYSSLAYLKRFRIDALKIDKTFVDNIYTSFADETIVRATINLAHSLGLRVVAEGVETPAQLQYLRQQGCDQLQGYLYGRPVPAPEFERLLQAQRAARSVTGQAQAGKLAHSQRANAGQD
jgi:EAL domain-containing protein (putative c-di-GMP-specific phosphodiesterase class I)